MVVGTVRIFPISALIKDLCRCGMAYSAQWRPVEGRFFGFPFLTGCGEHGENALSDKRDELIGTWKTDAQDFNSLQRHGETTLEFHQDGTLLYKIHQNGKDEIMFLTFQVEQGFIVTNQPSHPRPEKTAYEVTKDGKLILDYGGQKSSYQRIQ